MCRRTRYTHEGCGHQHQVLHEACDKALAGELCASVMFYQDLEGSCRPCREREEQEAWLADYHAKMEERRLADEARDKANRDEANRDEANRDEANRDEANRDEANRDEANRDEANRDEADKA